MSGNVSGENWMGYCGLFLFWMRVLLFRGTRIAGRLVGEMRRDGVLICCGIDQPRVSPRATASDLDEASSSERTADFTSAPFP